MSETPIAARRVEAHKLLILGCGRSGTLYTTKLFQHIGCDLGHERVGSFGTCSMYFVPETTDVDSINKGQKVPIHKREDRSQFRFAHIWHQVRDPLKTIDSLAKTFTTKVRIWTAEQMGVPLPGSAGARDASATDRLHWAMHYWLLGNRLSAAQSEWSYRLEVLPWVEMLSRLEFGPAPLPQVSSTTNRGLRYAFKTKEQTAAAKRGMYATDSVALRRIDAELYEAICADAVRYGYEGYGGQPGR